MDKLREEIGISIHAPREGSDRQTAYQDTVEDIFLSTLPVRGATKEKSEAECKDQFLSTLPVRGATMPFCVVPQPFHISIHAPREGSDGTRVPININQVIQFLSTLPVRGATNPCHKSSSHS